MARIGYRVSTGIAFRDRAVFLYVTVWNDSGNRLYCPLWMLAPGEK